MFNPLFTSCVGALMLFGLTTAQATIVKPLSFEELVKSSDTVAHGFVVEQWHEAPEGLPGMIYTYTVLEVAQVFKGEPSQQLLLRHIGGSLGQHVVRLSGTPSFELGEEVVVFVGSDEDVDHYVAVGLSQGVFSVKRTNDAIELTRDLSGLTFYNPVVRQFSLDPMPDRLPALHAEVIDRWADDIAKGGQ